MSPIDRERAEHHQRVEERYLAALVHVTTCEECQKWLAGVSVE